MNNHINVLGNTNINQYDSKPEIFEGHSVNSPTSQEGEEYVSEPPVKARSVGVVKWFNPTKGFGFITPEKGGLDVFVHQSEIQLGGFRSLAQGEYVEYELLNGEKGPKALNVTGPNGAPPKGAPRNNAPKQYEEKPTNATHYIINRLPTGATYSVFPPTVTVSSNQYVAGKQSWTPASPGKFTYCSTPMSPTPQMAQNFHFLDSPIGVNSPQFHFPIAPLSPTPGSGYTYPSTAGYPQNMSQQNPPTSYGSYTPTSQTGGYTPMYTNQSNYPDQQAANVLTQSMGAMSFTESSYE